MAKTFRASVLCAFFEYFVIYQMKRSKAIVRFLIPTPDHARAKDG